MPVHSQYKFGIPIRRLFMHKFTILTSALLLVFFFYWTWTADSLRMDSQSAGKPLSGTTLPSRPAAVDHVLPENDVDREDSFSGEERPIRIPDLPLPPPSAIQAPNPAPTPDPAHGSVAGPPAQSSQFTDASPWRGQQAVVDQVGSPLFESQFNLKLLRSLYLPDGESTVLQSDGNGLLTYVVTHPFPQVRNLPLGKRKRILVTGGAGFVGSHLVDRLMLMGHEVTVLDNFFTGDRRNVAHWLGHPNFELIRHDVVDPFMIEVDEIYHLACPASPPHYQYNPIKTVKTSVMGTINMLGLAKRVRAKFLLTSTSEVYGDPEVNPQPETYWGHVNPIGPRACYDEGKRVAETLSYAYAQQDKVQIRVARIFNTFGPRMNVEDGRVVSNFIKQALTKIPMTVYGDGAQTRSFQYVHDLVDGLIALMGSNYTQPVNIGNPEEYTILEFAKAIRASINEQAIIQHENATQDDPKQRRPDIRVANQHLNWSPRFSVQQGIEETVEYFKRVLSSP